MFHIATRQTLRKEKKMKPGYKTTEFWLTLVSTLVGGAVALGLLPNAEGEQLQGGLAAIITGVFAVIPVAVYVWSRVKIKTAVSVSGIEPAE